MVDRIDRHTVRINAKGIHAIHVDDEYIRRIRLPTILLAPCLASIKAHRFRFRADATSAAVRSTSI